MHVTTGHSPSPPATSRARRRRNHHSAAVASLAQQVDAATPGLLRPCSGSWPSGDGGGYEVVLAAGQAGRKLRTPVTGEPNSPRGVPTGAHQGGAARTTQCGLVVWPSPHAAGSLQCNNPLTPPFRSLSPFPPPAPLLSPDAFWGVKRLGPRGPGRAGFSAAAPLRLCVPANRQSPPARRCPWGVTHKPEGYVALPPTCSSLACTSERSGKCAGTVGGGEPFHLPARRSHRSDAHCRPNNHGRHTHRPGARRGAVCGRVTRFGSCCPPPATGCSCRPAGDRDDDDGCGGRPGRQLHRLATTWT